MPLLVTSFPNYSFNDHHILSDSFSTPPPTLCWSHPIFSVIIFMLKAAQSLTTAYLSPLHCPAVCGFMRFLKIISFSHPASRCVSLSHSSSYLTRLCCFPHFKIKFILNCRKLHRHSSSLSSRDTESTMVELYNSDSVLQIYHSSRKVIKQLLGSSLIVCGVLPRECQTVRG